MFITRILSSCIIDYTIRSYSIFCKFFFLIDSFKLIRGDLVNNLNYKRFDNIRHSRNLNYVRFSQFTLLDYLTRFYFKNAHQIVRLFRETPIYHTIRNEWQ